MLYASALGQLVFIAQLLVAGFILRTIQLRNPDSTTSKAIALLY